MNPAIYNPLAAILRTAQSLDPRQLSPSTPLAPILQSLTILSIDTQNAIHAIQSALHSHQTTFGSHFTIETQPPK